MADYTLIDPNTLLPGEPWTSAKALAAFENPEAIAEGAAGAPRIYQGAFERLVAGSEIRATVTASNSNPSGPTEAEYSFGLVQGGELRIGLSRSGSPAPASMDVKRTRAGVTTTVFSTASNPASVDISIIPGDVIRVSASYGGGTLASTATITATIGTNGSDLYPGPGLFGFIGGNRALT
jgi:hypothetical protein